MRIVGGTYRGRLLSAPEGTTTRPTSDRARESVFNIIESRLIKAGRRWDELSVFDAFAGTGALGIEAVSRGVRALFAAEKDESARLCWRKNTQGLKNASLILYSDVLALPEAQKTVDLLFMDPPYGKGLVAPALTELEQKGWLNADTLCLIEVEKAEQNFLPAGFVALDTRFYGKAKVVITKKG